MTFRWKDKAKLFSGERIYFNLCRGKQEEDVRVSLFRFTRNVAGGHGLFFH